MSPLFFIHQWVKIHLLDSFIRLDHCCSAKHKECGLGQIRTSDYKFRVKIGGGELSKSARHESELGDC